MNAFKAFKGTIDGEGQQSSQSTWASACLKRSFRDISYMSRSARFSRLALMLSIFLRQNHCACHYDTILACWSELRIAHHMQEARDVLQHKARPASAPGALSRPVRPQSPWMDSPPCERPGTADIHGSRESPPEEPPACFRRRPATSGGLSFEVPTSGYHLISILLCK